MGAAPGDACTRREDNGRKFEMSSRIVGTVRSGVAECRVPGTPPVPERLAMAKWTIENGSNWSLSAESHVTITISS